MSDSGSEMKEASDDANRLSIKIPITISREQQVKNILFFKYGKKTPLFFK